jgi:hypothetical protein
VTEKATGATASDDQQRVSRMNRGYGARFFQLV